MAESFCNLEDEAFPSFLSNSLGSSRATLGNVSLGSALGLPVAASTVAKIRAGQGADNRGDAVEASYLEGGQLSSSNSQSSHGERGKFAFSFKDDLEDADDFIAAHRFSNMLVKINMDETVSRTKSSVMGPPTTHKSLLSGRPTDHADDLSTGLLTFNHFGHNDFTDTKAGPLPMTVDEESVASEGADSDRCSGSVSSFLANEKLMYVDSIKSDLTDDDIDMNNSPDEELDLYFNKLVTPAMQRGRVEGQEIQAAVLPRSQGSSSNRSSMELEKNRYQFLDNFDQEGFQMPDVRLAATGMDSCPASDEEDTEDELETARRPSHAARTRMLPSTSRQLVGESHRPSFRPGLEGGSSDDEPVNGRSAPSLSGIEHRRSAEGQVINSPVTGDGGGGDGSSGSEESGGGGATISLPQGAVQTTYDALRGLGIVGSSDVGNDRPHSGPGMGRITLSRLSEMGDRVGPVGTGERSSSRGSSGGSPLRTSPVNWSMSLDRQVALDAMDNSQPGPAAEGVLDHLRGGAGHWRPQETLYTSTSHLQGTHSSFHLSQMLPPDCDEEEDEGVDECDGARPSLGLRGGPCGDVAVPGPSGSSHSSQEDVPLSTSLEPKYFSQSFQQTDSSDDGWNHCPDDVEEEFQQGGGANATHSVVYQNEEGKWVTDLAYYSSFEKEVDGNLPEEVVGQLQTEDFVPACNAIEKIIEDQEEFEKEHQFMQEEQMEPASGSPALADTSWKLPGSGHILMRASQVSSEFERGNQSYLRLSLGEFFQQRSEALGCLGETENDTVKRPSFGYVITSPEKREPFPLLRPSDFSSMDSSVQPSDADRTLNTEDLDKTLEAPVGRMSPKGDADPEPCEKDNKRQSVSSPPPPWPRPPAEVTGSSESADQSCVSPGNTSNLMLSISTIASAIADASLSSDPSQLAAMIMELSKRSRARPRHADLPPMEESAHNIEQSSALLDTLQRSLCAGELSAFDMEKYLRRADMSGSSESSGNASVTQNTTFDLLGWADGLTSSHRKSQAAPPAQDGPSSARAAGDCIESPLGAEGTERDRGGGASANDSRAEPRSNSWSSPPTRKSDAPRRSSIPRPKSSGMPTATSHPGRRSVGSGQSSADKPPLTNSRASASKPDPKKSGTANRTSPENRGQQAAIRLHGSTSNASTLQSKPLHSVEGEPPGPAAPTPASIKTSTGLRKGRSGLPCLKGSSPPNQRLKSPGRQQQERPRAGPENCPGSPAPPEATAVEKHVGFSCQSPLPTAHCTFEVFKSSSEASAMAVEESHCNFRPSTSPLTHSSPSQTSLPSTDGYSQTSLPSTDGVDVTARQPCCELSPQSTCSSPSLSRLTYISINDTAAQATPRETLSLSTTIVRASPTPPAEPVELKGRDVLDSDPPLHHHYLPSKSPDPAYPSRSPDVRSGSSLSCTRSQSECNHRYGGNRAINPPGYGQHARHSEPAPPQLTKVDSGYSSNLNIQQQPSSTMARSNSQQWGGACSVSTQGNEPYPGGGFGLPTSYSSEDLRYMPISSFKPQGVGMGDYPQHGGLLSGRSLFNSHLAQQYLGPDGPLHPGHYHIGSGTSGLYSVSSSGLVPNSDPSVRHLHGPTAGLGLPGGLPAGYHQQHNLRLHRNQLDPGMMGKGEPYSQQSVGPWATGGLPELGAQVVVPEELRFAHACCVGIASQTSLGIFNPTERWQQVAITITSLAIDGDKVDALPYQWLIVKNKTIIGPKTTEDQKVLFIPPKAGVYQCVLNVSSWPASAEADVAARADVFSKRVVLVAIAENPALEMNVGKAGGLDFGDLVGGSAKALPLNLLNRTRATVPIRLVISANATAWRCFTFSKSPVAMTAEGSLQAGHMTQLAAPSVMNHVMHASYGENPESFMVWVHFHAPQKYASCSGELDPPDEYSARVDVEVDSPGPSQVIQSIPLRARSGTARVHAPKDLQTVNLTAPLGKTSHQTLPLKNAGNIDVHLKLKSSDPDDCFSIDPSELSLRPGEEQGVVVSFSAQSSRKCRESVLTILVLPSGPQYEVVLKGEVGQEDGGRPAPVPSLVPGVSADLVPPILSNKQLMAWGGVTLGRAVQQKLVLRNNSSNTTQHLRLLIRGQDQDCFQLQSTFSSEERLTRHRELSIRPGEDVAVHLLFAPTRVACMLAKLDIKQSQAVRPSQPGIKFSIPLSGYGGTSNIILEDLRKSSDGYLATLTSVSAGRVSKVCLCVRNTGSRAAFIKAAAYSDLLARAVMDPALISLSPSQFILKERTQEVITVLMKCTAREQAKCQSAHSLLATVCLFCGDEVSRRQFRRMLQSKPEAGRKVLSENSLLKGIDFNEPFLGEEQLLEVFDLPLRPNEAQLFFGNMSKVVLSVLGTTSTSDPGESSQAQRSLPPTRHGSESHSSSGNSDRHVSNVSLDVLPVKGPQGPALKVAEGSLEKAAPSLEAGSGAARQGSWTIHPEQLVLSAPTINGAADTRQVQIQNRSNRELTFELSWPAHCLTITPQHGVIEPQCHLQILISPNPALATRSTLLPWSGQIYVQCDDQQKFIKVQIRQDLALDVSAAPGDRSLSALPPQAATPLLSVVKPQTQPPQGSKATVEINDKTIIFPATPSGETSESQVEVENGEEEVRWYLSSFAPPYVKGVDNSGDVFRATYTAFRCSRVSGTLGAREKMQVPVTFLPRDRGDYAQFWDLECHPVAEPQQKTRLRFQLCGTGVKAGPMQPPQEGDCSLVRTEATGKTRKKPDAAMATKTGQEEGPGRGVYLPQDVYGFPATRVGESSTLKVSVRNNSFDTHELSFAKPREPFHIKHSKYSLRSQHYLKLPVQFKPSQAGSHEGLLLIQSETSGSLIIQLTGEAVP
ncbi:centrosomal protein of 192 kDa [Aplochiton taeniatus]